MTRSRIFSIIIGAFLSWPMSWLALIAIDREPAFKMKSFSIVSDTITAGQHIRLSMAGAIRDGCEFFLKIRFTDAMGRITNYERIKISASDNMKPVDTVLVIVAIPEGTSPGGAKVNARQVSQCNFIERAFPVVREMNGQDGLPVLVSNG